MKTHWQKKKCFLLCLFIATVFTSLIISPVYPVFGVAHTDSPLDPYSKIKLENGLTLVVKEVHSAPIAAVDIWVATGAKNETPGEAGISHFFEHMIFKGTTKRKVGEIAKEIKAVGGYLNAATSLDTTHYYVVVPSVNIDLALEVEADAIMNSSFDPAEIDRERKVILEERKLKEGNPQGKLGLMAYQAVFRNTPYANDVLGTAETLAKINRDTFLGYYRKFYHPGNMVVVVVGDVDTEHIVNQVRKLFRDFKTQKTTSIPEFPVPKLKSIQKIETEMDVDQTYLYFGFPGPGMNHHDLPALTVLGVILGGGQSSRFYQIIQEEKQLVNEIGAGYNAYQKIGMFAIYAQMKDTDSSVLEAEIRAIHSQVIKKGITEAELSRAKALVRSDIAYAMESDADIAGIIGEYQVNRDVEDGVTFMAELQKVNVKDIQRVAKKYLNPEAYILAVVKPQEVK